MPGNKQTNNSWFSLPRRPLTPAGLPLAVGLCEIFPPAMVVYQLVSSWWVLWRQPCWREFMGAPSLSCPQDTGMQQPSWICNVSLVWMEGFCYRCHVWGWGHTTITLSLNFDQL